jgi:3-dehydroquinate dehydratase / shikimate dehydrogenase
VNKGKLCVSVCAETADELVGKIKRADKLADVIEVRFDCLNESELVREYSAIDRDVRQRLLQMQLEHPLISTFRPKTQGGSRKLTLEERRDFWNMGFDSGWADLEEDVLHFASNWLWDPVIASFHDLSGETSRLNSVIPSFERLAIDGVDIVKIAVNADDITDSIPVWNLLEHAKSVDKHIIPIAMGEAGKWTRILGLAHGAFLTYGALDSGDETAPGQLTAAELIEVYRIKQLDLDTEVYGVIGNPVATSLSPVIHNAAFAFLKRNAVFVPLQVKDLDAFVRRMVRPETREIELNFAGFAVTMPHKQSIMKHLDEIDPVAAAVGAVNTVSIKDGRLTGYNTDVPGFVEPLIRHFGDLHGARVAVFGSGGAARACIYGLDQNGADVAIFARDETKAKALAEQFAIEAFPISKFKDQTSKTCFRTFDIVVNATPIGMEGDLADQKLFTADELHGVKFVFDIVTRSDETPLIREAKAAGVPAIGGIEMLLAQGMKQHEIWTGEPGPEGIMREAISKRDRKTAI